MKSENIKLVEIRDRATFIPAFAIRMIPEADCEKFLMSMVGYRDYFDPCIILISIEAPWHSARHWDEWTNSPRTMKVAHRFIEENWNDIKNGEVIDVEFILKEVDKPCLPCNLEMINELLKSTKIDVEIN